MMHFTHRTDRRFGPAVTVCACVLGIALCLSGCASMEDIKRKTRHFTRKASQTVKDIGTLNISSFSIADSGLKRTVTVGPIRDTTGFSEKDFGIAFQRQMVELLRSQCTGNRFVQSGDPDYPEGLDPMPRNASGDIDGFALTQIGRREGLQTVITGTVIDIRRYSDERGILWFRDTHQFLQVLVNIEAFDMQTAAKLIDESYLYETELEPIEFEDFTPEKNRDLLPYVNEALADAVVYMKDELCSALRQQPWVGYVSGVSGNRAELSSGSEAGLAVGRVLDVLAQEQIVEGAGGQRFFKPGEKLGEIRIVEVTPQRAVAEIVAGTPVQVGSTVRPQ